MEAVTPDAALVVFVGQTVELRDHLLRLVEGGIEAGDLRQLGSAPPARHGSPRGCAADAAAPAARSPRAGHRLRRDQQRRRVIGAAMHDAVTDTRQHAALETRAQQSGDPLQGLRVVATSLVLPLLVGNPLAGTILDLEARCRAQPFDLADGDGAHLTCRRHCKERELQARRAGVEDQNHLFHFSLRSLSGPPQAAAGHQAGDRTRGELGAPVVGAAGQDDRHARAEHDPRAIGIAHESELLGENVAGGEIGNDDDVGIAGDHRVDLLDACRFLADRVVEGQRAIEDGTGDLATVGHLAQRGGVGRADHARIDRLDGADDRHLGECDAEHRARSMAFWQMSRLVSRSGAMLIAASVTISGLW
jgi:hypothetical protein